MPDQTYKTLIQLVRGLSMALKERDPYTRYHSDRVTNLAVEMGIKLGLSGTELKLLEAAGALHDIGKIGVPDSILLKEGMLASDERTLIKTHSERGAGIVLSLDHDGCDVVANTILHHHENFDGSGYPHGVAGEQIPLLSRIITIADNYDAMATNRVYQKARPHTRIIDEMQGELGQKHDPQLFDIFIKMIEKSENRAA
ncbi:MAG TPA: HD domain-containing phosphohydrolase [Gallionella sp.]|nr:HD domain-containing phosphohydrolase [Gallionella sp.]